MPKQQVVLIMGSRTDLAFTDSIVQSLKKLKIDHEINVASAHKTPEHLLKILKKHEQTEDNIVYITVAGLSDALSGVVAGFTRFPVIACPPDTEKQGWPKVFSSIMTPKGIAVSFVSQPENAALAAAKILAFSDPSLYKNIEQSKQRKTEEVIKANSELQTKRHEKGVDAKG